MRKKIVLNSPRIIELKKRKHQTLRRKIFFLSFLVVLIFVGLAFLSRWSNLNISNIKISGNKIIETKVLEQIVREKISGNYLWVFPKTNFVLYPKKEIEKEFNTRFKRIHDISLNVKNFKTLNISLVERTALYTWCGVVPEELENGDRKCYFLDKDGYIFDEAPYISGDVYFRFYGTNDLNTINPLGGIFFKQNFSKLVSLKETTEKMGIKPVAIYSMENGDLKILLTSKSKTRENPEILLKANSDFVKVMENLQSVITTEPLQSEFKNKYSSLLYIDLRFGNKVYYKFK